MSATVNSPFLGGLSLCDHECIVLTGAGKVNVDIISVYYKKEDGLPFPQSQLAVSLHTVPHYCDASLLSVLP